MKNLLPLLLLLIGVSTFVSAQSVCLIQPNPATAVGTFEDEDVPADAKITNLTGNTIHMKWERQVINITPGCETAVCDPNNCFGRSISFRNFNMDPNEVGDMLVHFYGNGAACESVVHIKITNLDNPSDSTIAVYLFNQNTATKDIPKANVRVYPNPVTDYFSLENAENVAVIRIFTLDGREVARFDATANALYPCSNQPAGNYVIALSDKNGRTFQALELKKL